VVICLVLGVLLFEGGREGVKEGGREGGRGCRRWN